MKDEWVKPENVEFLFQVRILLTKGLIGNCGFLFFSFHRLDENWSVRAHRATSSFESVRVFMVTSLKRTNEVGVTSPFHHLSDWENQNNNCRISMSL